MKKGIALCLVVCMLFVFAQIACATSIYDVNNDGIVDSNDVDIVSTAMNTTSGDPNYNPAYDFNQDGTINMIDIMLVVKNFT